MKSSKILLFGLIGILIFVLILLGGRYQTKLSLDNFKLFNESNLDGIISYVGIKNHGVSFKLENDTSEYVFYPISDKTINGGHIFNYFAEPGDKVIKEAYGDTLLLIKSDNTYKYTFLKMKD